MLRLHVLSVRSEEMSPSVIVQTTNDRYLFNAGDGIQRFCMEHKQKLGKLRVVFVTQLQADTLGGLPGMLLTLSDTGKENLDIRGPRRTKQYVHAIRHVVHRPNTTIVGQDLLSSEQCYAAEDVKITPVVVMGPNTAKRGSDGERKEQEGLPVVSYLVESPPVHGKFLVEKALAQGVPKGPLFGKLKKGEDVKLENGTIVTSLSCVEPGSPPMVCAIIDCPSSHYVKSLSEHAIWNQYSQVELMVHFTCFDVVQLPEYQTFLRRFGDTVQHLYLDHPNCTTMSAFRSSSLLQCKLATLCPDSFSMPKAEKKPVPLTASNETIGENLLSYTLIPLSQKGYCRKKCYDPVDVDVVKQELDKILQGVTLPIVPVNEERKRNRITFLGTGSAIPSKYRNVTSMYLELASGHGILLDAGEGCYGQMWRCSDQDTMETWLSQLRGVLISHIHADHHLGLAKILRKRDIALDPLVVIGPLQLEYWLKEYGEIDPSIQHKYKFLNCTMFQPSTTPPSMELIGLKSLIAIPVQHCQNSFAFVLEGLDQWKVSFSGDCRPSTTFATNGLNSDVLIHEATFEDTMTAEAKSKKHCTTTEAIRIGEHMHAKHIVLTHFSQRYPKLPVLSPELSYRVVFAFDCLQSTTHSLTYLPEFRSTFEKIFQLEEDVIESI